MLAVPDPRVVALLANATHFTGTWTTEFDPDDTRVGEFTRDDGATVSVPLMRAEDCPPTPPRSAMCSTASKPTGGAS